VRVRAAWVSDADITAMAASCTPVAPALVEVAA
jgi:hypothetical protein